MRQISNYTKDIPGHHGCRGVIGQSSSELEMWGVDTCQAITIKVGAKYLAEWENQVVSSRLEEKRLVFCVCTFPPMRLTCREMQRVKVYWRCWSDWGSSLSAIHMSLGRVSSSREVDVSAVIDWSSWMTRNNYNCSKVVCDEGK